jgi:protein-L-isoaspartate(D-aspartate) O-methyltransferase
MPMSKTLELMRNRMVQTQIISRGIKDQRVIDAMLKVPRELFIPDSDKSRSYDDGPLSIGYGQTISQPYIVAYMTDLLDLSGDERVLEIGTGSGYQTAILAEIAEQVFTVEVIEHLSKRAEELLTDRLGLSNIHFKIDNGREGWSQHAPFDRILITAAPHHFPKSLFSQLAEDGIAIAPVGDYIQQIKKYLKKDGRVEEDSLIGVSFVPLI